MVAVEPVGLQVRSEAIALRLEGVSLDRSSLPRFVSGVGLSLLQVVVLFQNHSFVTGARLGKVAVASKGPLQFLLVARLVHFTLRLDSPPGV
jgi:hypothetical protein